MTAQKNLLGKYYSGDTSLEEEKQLKRAIVEEEFRSAEQDMFNYFDEQAAVPENLEDDLFAGIQKQQKVGGKTRRMRWYSIASAAAVVLIVLTVYLDFRKQKNAKLENDFLVMESALLHVSQSIQPEEQQEMMVLWVDDEVEIIIN